MKKLRMSSVIVVLLIGLVAFNATKTDQSLRLGPRSISAAGFGSGLLTKNKAEIVNEINHIITNIDTKEKLSGKTGPGGFIVYTSLETEQFLKLYQALILRLHYLNYGNLKINLKQWAGYPLTSEPDNRYGLDQVFRAMIELEKNKVPKHFVANFRIYLLPFVIPDVSGLGGAGYTMLSAQPAAENLIPNQLPVTLYHEFGHHINFSYMPKNTSQGNNLWAEFLQIRGGSWHGPGSVNTKAWSESSEETFAEDFRMLFGKDQPFFGDLVLGDPRSNIQRAKKEKAFIINLARNKAETSYKSPWIPVEGNLFFWRNQGELLISLWVFLGIGIFIVNFAGYYSSRKQQTYRFLSRSL
jgi:hypothetical protein